MHRWSGHFSQLAALALAAAIPPGAFAADAIRNIPFSSPGAPGNQLLLNLYQPGAGTRPIATTIIIVHGGSYNSGSRTDFDSLALALADLGYTVISPDYTLVTNAASYPQPISDLLNVVHWVRTEGELINLPNTVILSGISAGSTIAMTAAMAAGSPNFTRLQAPPHRGYTIDGAIGVMGRYDLVWNVYFGIPQTVVNYIGVPLSNPNWIQTWNQASAISYINASSPPTFLIHGTNDGLVPYLNSVRLYLALTVAGAPAQLALIPGGGHDMSILGPTNALQAQTIAAAAAWIASSIAPPAPGSCCAPNGFCSISIQVACPWTFTSAGICSPNPCPPPLGTCCSPSAECSLTPQAVCPAASTWTLGAICQANPCPRPMGACCAADGSCQSTLLSACSAQWTIFGACTPNPCAQPVGSCCAASGACALTFESACQGTWTIFGACFPNPCPQPIGACCMGVACAVTLQSMCAGPNHRFTTINAACNAPLSTVTPCCHADFDHNDSVAVGDIFAFLADWFASSPDCSTSPSPTSTPTVQDIFDFLAAWFSGC